jgi:hypothetical protein
LALGQVGFSKSGFGRLVYVQLGFGHLGFGRLIFSHSGVDSFSMGREGGSYINNLLICIIYGICLQLGQGRRKKTVIDFLNLFVKEKKKVIIFNF